MEHAGQPETEGGARADREGLARARYANNQATAASAARPSSTGDH
jgi:hypothetical protein